MSKAKKPQTVKDLLQWAAFFLGIENRIEAELLLAKVCNFTRAKLLAYPEIVVEEDTVNLYLNLVKQRKAGEPLQYLLGKQNFMGLDFIVNSSVLIPRSDTEILVEEAINIANQESGPVKILDLCTGSGAIAISIVKNVPFTGIIAVDISAEALKIAEVNAEINGVKDRVAFITGDLFEPVESLKFDIIVSNPPYISTNEMVNLPGDVKREPHLALWGGEDGLDFYKRIVKNAGTYLNKSGHLIVEIGWQQGHSVLELFKKAGFSDCRVIKDWAGNDRVVKGIW